MSTPRAAVRAARINAMNSILPSALFAVFLPCLSVSATAQVLLSRWVAPSGSPGNGQHPLTPWVGLDTAVANVGALLASGQVPAGAVVTLNVLPGTYSPASTVLLPARGIRVEAWGSTTRPIVTTRIRFETNGDPAHGPSELRHLDLRNGVEVVPTDPGTTEVRVRDCAFLVSDGSFGYRSQVDFGHAANVVEACTFVSETEVNGGIGIWEQAGNSSSCLYRANVVRGLAHAMLIGGTSPDPMTVRPRVISNAFELGERLVQLDSCAPWFVANSVGAFRNHGLFTGTDVVGVGIFGCPDYVAANNIVWFVPTAGTFLGAIDSTTSVGTETANYLSTMPGTTDPFVAGQFPRLDPASGIDEAGDTSFVLPPITWPNGLGGTAPADVTIDFEGDMRTQQGSAGTMATAIGADQITVQRCEVLQPTSVVDAFGTVHVPISSPAVPSFTVRTTGLEPGSTFVMALSFGYDEIATHVVLSPYGSGTTLPFAPYLIWRDTVIGTGSSVDTVLPSLPLSSAFDFLEFEYFAQAIAIAPDGTGRVTNRLRFELDL